jgi:NADH:ubiquinone oxidoreductase subunit 6 (subunit J)
MVFIICYLIGVKVTEEITKEFLDQIPKEYWESAGFFASDLFTDYKMYVEFVKEFVILVVELVLIVEIQKVKRNAGIVI